ncbi:MAG: hypothetical protein NTZ78_13870 [Candidatus Aureabacteria bacterium]|nr:hypothetical protein [Candidatus Auribacterota bacterium]
MRRLTAFFVTALSLGAVCLAQSTEPVGPSGWTTRNWIGFTVQISLFVLAVLGVYKLADWKDDDSQDPNP